MALIIKMNDATNVFSYWRLNMISLYNKKTFSCILQIVASKNRCQFGLYLKIDVSLAYTYKDMELYTHMYRNVSGWP